MPVDADMRSRCYRRATAAKYYSAYQISLLDMDVRSTERLLRDCCDPFLPLPSDRMELDDCVDWRRGAGVSDFVDDV
jgi:hypothetical protein